LPPMNCMPTKPQAMSAIAIHTPPASSSASSASSRTDISRSSAILHSALDGLLDDFFRRLRLRLLVTRRIAAHDVEEFIDEGDQQDDEPGRVAELRDPQRHRQHALRHVAKAPRVPGHAYRVPGEEADEAAADDERADFDPVAFAAFDHVDQ